MTILALGDNCIDVYLDDHLGYPGGGPVNTAVYLRRLGANAAYSGAVGTDPAGKLLLTSLQQEGVNTDQVQVLPGVTNLAFVRHQHGDRVFVGRRAGVRDQYRWQQLPETTLRRATLIHTTIDAGLDDLLPVLAQWQVPVAYDFSKKFTSQHEHLLSYLRVAFASGAHLTTAQAHDLARRWVELGATWTVITRGEHGSVGFDGQTLIEQPAQPVTSVVDTLGCGDAMIAGVLHALAQGQDLARCLQQGSHVAAQALAIRGGYGHGTPLHELDVEAALPGSPGVPS